ncbi:MAG: 3-phosphoshikimate 1-carboxyvinyltransferase, partial [Methanosarcinaceae archaeon]|nr:3-phosphoshikimate 1-carboxyvinyltransferase [Methanosarcinaceae archaeon]
MMVSVGVSAIHGEVQAPPSKSYTHRAITIAALSRESIIHGPLMSDDTLATVKACEMFGANIQKKDGDLVIRGVEGMPRVPE